MTHCRYLLALLFIGAAFGQTPKIEGDYSATLGPLRLKLHLKSGPFGVLEGALDSLDQGALGLACANIQQKEKALSFDVPSVNGKWHGTVSDDGATLEGSWSQGAELPLVFHRDEVFAAAAKPSKVDGIWRGTLDAGGAKLRIQLQVKIDRAGKEVCSIDSLDQGAIGLACDKVQVEGNRLSFDVPSVKGHWSGTLSENGSELDGTWSQGSDLPLKLTRQTAALTPKPPEPPKYDAAMAPVPLSELKAVLDKDLAPALSSGALASSTGGGVTVGVLQHGVRRIFTYGTAKEDSIFEIGSISKTFTGLILAQMIGQGRVKLDEPVRDLLPKDTVAKPAGGEITLLDLVTQHSGLPRMPDNFNPANPLDPYADYRPANLYEFIAKHGVTKPANAGFLYSNLGVGLLGQALSNRAGAAYPELLYSEIAEPLGLKDTVVKLSGGQEKRFIQGHAAQHQPAQPWNIDALAGAGAIRSTAGDMLSYLAAQLHPEGLKNSDALSRAIKMTHEPRADAMPSMKIAFAWLFDTDKKLYWHNGATGGYSSYAAFNPEGDYAVVVLFNTTIGANGSFADRLGAHIVERLGGKAAISLAE